MSPSREHSSIHGERTGFNFHFVWKLNYFILLLQAKPARKQTVKKYLNQGNINPLPPCHNSVQLLSLQELQMLSFASKHHFFIHFISQNFKILPFSTLANTLHWTPLLPSDSDFEHNFMNDKRWPLSYFLCRLLSAGLFSTVLVFFAQCFIFTALIRHLYQLPRVLGIIGRGSIVQCIKHILENCFWQWFCIYFLVQQSGCSTCDLCLLLCMGLGLKM